MNPNNSNNSSTAKQIVILGTGGTIAGKAASSTDNVGYTAAQLGVAQLLAAIPSLTGSNGAAQYGDYELVCEQVAQVDSKDMNFAVWQQLLARCAHWLAQPQVQGVVVTHGTDTLEETAYFLQAVLNPSKPVVLACAMRPSTAIAPDGPQNLMDALAVAVHSGAQGVVGVCAGLIHSAVDVQKVHTSRLDAFSSGDAGPVGTVAEGQLVLYRNWPSNKHLASVNVVCVAIENIAKMTALPRVEIVYNHTGSNGAIVDALLAQKAAPSGTGLRGIVVAATGNGTISTELEAALRRAHVAGVVVWRSTRCAFGQVIGKSEAEFGDASGASQGLPAVKARIALQLALAQ
ncbi:MAG: asparaginase [Burkholderiaceae bacterium]